MTAHVEATKSKPVGVSIIGVFLILFGVSTAVLGLSILGSVLFGGSAGYPPLLVGAGGLVTMTVAVVAMKVGQNLVATPATNRLAGEIAMWTAIPVTWTALITITLFVTEGEFDTTLFVTSGISGVVWTAVFVGAALYMRSRSVRSYFSQNSG